MYLHRGLTCPAHEHEVCVQKRDRLSDADTIILGTVDVVLFNPTTMTYDGSRISGVPLDACVTALGLNTALAEARSTAVAHVCATAGGQLDEARQCIQRVGG